MIITNVWLNVTFRMNIPVKGFVEDYLWIRTTHSIQEGLTPLFFNAIICKTVHHMDRQKLKLIVKNLELLVDSLKSEVYSDTQAYKQPDDSKFGFNYDDGDDDGYPD